MLLAGRLWGVWFEVGSFHIGWKLSGDLLTAHMLVTVTGVSFAVHLYAVVYMRSDPHLNLFMSYLSLFTFFMLVLVTADNLVLMLVGWEGIGVCSYLLIGWWAHRLSAVKSAGKAILVNRVSDGVLMWGVVWIWHHTGALEYDLVLMGGGPVSGMSVLVGAMGKSAQILFHVWLADAMEGPTPVSALIHAATLVTAGVYLMVRLAPFWDDLVILVGSLTAFMAGVFGYFQSDLKRVIAFSTCSQLGYMMVSVGLGELGAEASLSHLMTHASFKAALFLAAGLVIGVSGGHQHVARYGALSGVHTSLFCFMTLVLASASLVGWPELSGFYSKETILNLSYGTGHALADVGHTLMLVTAFLTSCYSAKLIFQGFVMDLSGFGLAPASSASDWILPTLAMTLLLTDIVLKVWIGTNLLSGIVWFVPWGVKTLPFGLVVAGILSALAGTAIWMNNLALVRLCGTRWGFDQVFARLLVNATLDWGRQA
jgi:proton-translocating NADH-quinone oxidoreductase chain L